MRHRGKALMKQSQICQRLWPFIMRTANPIRNNHRCL
nr:MAG TPA: hypothetical protein [Caudoviricetes sp.]